MPAVILIIIIMMRRDFIKQAFGETAFVGVRKHTPDYKRSSGNFGVFQVAPVAVSGTRRKLEAVVDVMMCAEILLLLVFIQYSQDFAVPHRERIF